MKIYIVTESWGEYEDRHKVVDKAFFLKDCAENYVVEKNIEDVIRKEQYDKCNKCRFRYLDYNDINDIDSIIFTCKLVCKCDKYKPEIDNNFHIIGCNNQVYDGDISYYDIEEVDVN